MTHGFFVAAGTAVSIAKKEVVGGRAETWRDRKDPVKCSAKLLDAERYDQDRKAQQADSAGRVGCCRDTGNSGTPE